MIVSYKKHSNVFAKVNPNMMSQMYITKNNLEYQNDPAVPVPVQGEVLLSVLIMIEDLPLE